MYKELVDGLHVFDFLVFFCDYHTCGMESRISAWKLVIVVVVVVIVPLGIRRLQRT